MLSLSCNCFFLAPLHPRQEGRERCRKDKGRIRKRRIKVLDGE